MNILIKYPSRGRPELFRNSFHEYNSKLSGKHHVEIFVTIDRNDPGMNNMAIKEFIASYPAARWSVGTSRNKIDAFNRDFDLILEQFPGFELLIVAQDDAIPEPEGYDDICATTLSAYHPDTDGALHFDDGYQNQNLATMSIMGRKMFDRFGYIYHPDYVSLFADNEYMEVCRGLKRMTYTPQVVLRHDWHVINDEMRRHTESFKSQDHDTFLKRKAAGFPRESIFQ